MPLVAAVCAIAAPSAYAGNQDAPGTLKKQIAGSDTPAAAPVQAPTPVTPAAGKKDEPVASAPAKVNPRTPVNRGTGKKLTQSSGSSTAASTPVATARITKRPRARRRSARAASVRAHPVVRRKAAHPATPAAARARTAAGAAASASALATTTAANRAVRAKAQPAANAPAAQPEATDPGALQSVAQAADSVVEVIPGAVLLALAGLGALVLLLVARSWLMDRGRVKALEQSYAVTVEALATAIEAKDHTTGGHIERVRRLGLLLAAEMVPRDARDPQMAYGFLLHDIGKLAVPDAILRAPGRLSEEQWMLMRRHPEEGVRMLSAIPFLDRGLDVVRHHHERWDGGGYPDGLRGEDIPLWARIFAVVDALDAITAERPYRPRRPYETALAEIRLHAGTQFDPAVVDALERIDPARIEPLLEPAQQLEPAVEPQFPDAPALFPLIPA
ncbi:MAG: HD-GYP domain-containing protein [Thermoleophilaceae bacterium]